MLVSPGKQIEMSEVSMVMVLVCHFRRSGLRVLAFTITSARVHM